MTDADLDTADLDLLRRRLVLVERQLAVMDPRARARHPERVHSLRADAAELRAALARRAAQR
jgi:hypothetical protein